MYKLIACFTTLLILTGCSLFQVHKMDIEQGNVITTEDVHQLHIGMTEADVKRVMGEPVFVDIFSEDRLTYLYTFKQGHGTQVERRVICLFQHGRLQNIT